MEVPREIQLPETTALPAAANETRGVYSMEDIELSLAAIYTQYVEQRTDAAVNYFQRLGAVATPEVHGESGAGISYAGERPAKITPNPPSSYPNYPA